MEGGNTLLPAPSLGLSPPPPSLAGHTSENRGPGEDRPELNDHIPSPKSPGRTRRVSQAAPWRQTQPLAPVLGIRTFQAAKLIGRKNHRHSEAQPDIDTC